MSVNLFKGALLMSTANVAFCAMACLVKYVSSVNVYTTTLFRFLIGLGVLGILAMSGRVKLAFVDKPALFLRGLMGGVAICIGFFSITRLGIIKASVIVYMYPVFATLFGCLLLRERVSARKIAATAGAFAGACVLLFDKKSSAGLFAGFGLYEIVAITGAVIAGLTVVSVKKLHETDSTVAIFFAQCLVGLWIVLIPASVDTGTISLPSSIIMVAIGLLATAGQLLSTDSYRYMSVSNGSLLVMISPILSCMAGVLFFHEHMTIRTISGAAIVLGSTGFALLAKE